MKSIQCSSIVLVLLRMLSLVTSKPSLGAMPSLKMEKSWTYELKSVETNSSDRDLMDFKWKIERIGRGVYAMSGEYKVNYDIVEGDDNDLEFTSYRSENGVDEYQQLPFRIPRMHTFKFFNSFYKDMAMETLKECSDMPAFKDNFVPPYEKKTYSLNKCQFSQDGYPEHLQDGFYKVVIQGFGKVEWSLSIVAQVERNL